MFKLNFRLSTFSPSKILVLLTFLAFVFAGQSGQAMAAAITAVDTANSVVTDPAGDTLDAAAHAGTTGSNVVFTNDGGSAAEALTLTVTGAGTVNVGTVTNTSADAGDTATLTVGDGNANTILIVNGDFTSNAVAAATSADINTVIDASSGGTGNSSLTIFGTVDTASGFSLSGDADGTATLTLGDGTNGRTMSGTIDMGSSAGTVSVLNLAAGGINQAGAINLASVGASSVTINMATGSTISGAISDTADAGTFTLNVDGNATVSAAIDAGTTTTATIVIDTGATLTASGTGAITVDTITIDGTGVLNLTGAKTITGTINGLNAVEGTLDIDANTTLSSNVGSTNSLSSVDIAAVTVAVNGDLSATTTNFSADGTANVALNRRVVGAVTATNTNEGTLVFATTTANTTIASSTIGATGRLLKQLTAGAATGITATIGGDVFATTISVSNTAADGTVAFSGNVTATTLNFTADGVATLADSNNITAAVTTGTGNTGTLTFLGTSTMTGDIATSGTVLKAVNINGSNGTVTLTGDLHATTTTIANLATLTFSKASTTVTGSITAAGTTGTLNVGTATVTPSGNVTLGAGSTLAVTIGDTNGRLVSTAGAGLTLQTGTTIAPTVSGTLVAGDIIIVQNNDNNLGLGDGVTTGITITDNSSQFNFSLTLTGSNLVLTVIDTGSSAGLSSNSAAINNVTTAAFASDSALNTALGGLTGSAREAALETLSPVVDGGGVAGAFSAGGATSSSVSTRTASLRTGVSAGQGLNAGDEISEKRHFWFQGFGTYADQGTRQGLNGFTSVTGGFAMGADKQVDHDLVLGLAGSFAYSDVNASLSQNRTTVNSYQTTLYGSYELGKYFIDGQVGLAYNGYSGHRFINVGNVERTAVSDYSGYQVSGLVEVGREMPLPKEVKFTPILGLGYTHVGIPEYSETGAGTSNLNVNGQDYDILNVSFRGEFRRTYEMEMGNFTPEVKLGYNYEAFDNAIQNISAFNGGGSTFETVGFDPENHSFLAGAGIAFESTDNFDFVASYDLVSKTDYKSHSFLLKGRWSF